MIPSLAFAFLSLATVAGGNLHVPLDDLRAETDEVGREILDAFPAYDHASILAAIERLDAREEPREEDDYLKAEAMLDVLLIRRFYEKDREDAMPPELAAIDRDEYADRALEIARRFADAHPEHSDIHRVMGELYSTKIRGMTAAMSNGPKAKEQVDKALELDENNALALQAQARMHYHNPSFAGGDKELALEEFRRVANETGYFRAYLYLARIYLERDMPAQARFFCAKARRAAPENPEAKHLLQEAREAERDSR